MCIFNGSIAKILYIFEFFFSQSKQAEKRRRVEILQIWNKTNRTLLRLNNLQKNCVYLIFT